MAPLAGAGSGDGLSQVLQRILSQQRRQRPRALAPSPKCSIPAARVGFSRASEGFCALGGAAQLPHWRIWASLPESSSALAAVASVASAEEILDRVREAIGISKLDKGCLVKLIGEQSLMAMDGQWEFIFSPEGEFAEAYAGSELACVAACDGSIAWEADAAGRIAMLDLDDREVCILTSWLRSGFWVERRALNDVDIRLLEESDWEYLQDIDPIVRMDLDPTTSDFLAVSLKETKAIMYVAISRSTWLPHSAILYAYGTAALARLDHWQPISADVPFLIPGESNILRESGDLVTTRVTSGQILALDKGTPQSSTALAARSAVAAASIYPRESLFRVPSQRCIPVPLDTHPIASLDQSIAAEVEAHETSSGHILVRPLIDGKDIGFFILDTGASTFTIEPAVADKLGLRKFGSVHTVTVNGPAQCSFRDASTFTLGRLRIQRPRFVDVAGAALADRGMRVVGICGYDVFCHSTVHIVRGKERGRLTVRLLDPSSSLDETQFLKDGQQVTWIAARMLSSTPHVSLSFLVNWNSPREEALFLLDTGAAGTDLIFNSKATADFGLWPRGTTGLGGGLMRGMGSAGAGKGKGKDKEAELGPGMSVTQRNLAEVSIAAGISLKNATAIVMSPEQKGLQLSSYTAGLICQNLLGKYDLIFDYERNRVGVVTQIGQSPLGHEAAKAG